MYGFPVRRPPDAPGIPPGRTAPVSTADGHPAQEGYPLPGEEAGVYGWYFSSTVSAPPDRVSIVTRTVTLSVFAATSSWCTVHVDVP